MGNHQGGPARERKQKCMKVIRGDIERPLEIVGNNARGEYVIVIEGRPADEIKAEGRNPGRE